MEWLLHVGIKYIHGGGYYIGIKYIYGVAVWGHLDMEEGATGGWDGADIPLRLMNIHLLLIVFCHDQYQLYLYVTSTLLCDRSTTDRKYLS